MDNIQKKGYVLEFGHLSRDKGTDTLLEVAKSLFGTSNSNSYCNFVFWHISCIFKH